jgi:hypothetical protein
MSLLPRGAFGKLCETLREFGLRETLERSALWIADRVLASTLHRHRRASLSAFAESAASMHFSADTLARTYLFPENGEANLPQLYSEYHTLNGVISGRYTRLIVPYPKAYAVEPGSAFLLYALVRCHRPAIVLETGVANGHSSFFILNALRANGHGLLHSIDRSGEVGCLLSGEERERWRLHVLPSRSLKKSFLDILASLPPVDLFLHDSDHTYQWQFFELQAALQKLAPGGVLASDDCDGSNAFLDVCRSCGVLPAVLIEARKVFGFVFLQPEKPECLSVPCEVCAPFPAGSQALRLRSSVHLGRTL